ncbi:adenylosuccinate lyase [Candidatus Peregrinibacteria bacterium]|nr:adenylosuccinate lyase [Candidatus Peregrinibacteria bacterium]
MLDSRCSPLLERLRNSFSEEALIRARLRIEILYFIALSREKAVKELPQVTPAQEKTLMGILKGFKTTEAQKIKEIEEVTRHDVKAVEYELKDRLEKEPALRAHTAFLHFGLTSEDVNNLAYGILVHDALCGLIVPNIEDLLSRLMSLAMSLNDAPLLSLTHGQPATPTTMGKELRVFASRLERQLGMLRGFRMQGKLGGAVGTLSAHRVAYPRVDWEGFRQRFVSGLGLIPLEYTTQINPHDDLAELSHLMIRINTILLDMSRDLWLYISRGIFRQKVIAGEVGSSTMPHKINPIDFENAEGNLGLSTALFTHFAEKLPVSRLQRDLSDSTVQRSLGVAFGYHVLAVQAHGGGLSKLTLNAKAANSELQAHPEVWSEAIQTVLRKHGVKGAYEKLKTLTRGEKVTWEGMRSFVRGLAIDTADKQALIKLLKKGE